jgi:phage tail sheath gpL-like
MAISFSSIPPTIRTPGTFVEFDASRAIQGAPAQPHQILVIVQRLASGTAAEGEVKQILNSDQGETFFGRGSIGSAMIKAAKAANSFTPMFAIALDDDGGATAATKIVTITGTATAAGSIFLYIHGKRVVTPIPDTTTAAAAGPLVDAAIVAAQSDQELQMTSAAVLGVVTLTARNAGEAGEQFDVRTNFNDGEEDVPGLTVVVTDGVTGATNPSIATAITAIGAIQYHTIIHPYTDATNLAAIEAEMDARWQPLADIDGHAFTGITGTLSDHTTLGSGRNSAFSTIIGGGESPTTPWEWAANVGAVDAFEPDPARPRQTLRLRSVLPPAREDQFDRAERETLLNNGIASHVVDLGGNVSIERLITTFQTDALGNPSTVFLDITTPRTLSRIRFDWRTRIATKYPRHKLANDGTLFSPGQAVVTPNVIRGEALDLFTNTWEPGGLVEGFEQFQADLIVERSTSDPNRVDAQLAPDLINQLRVSATSIQFLI